MFLKFKCGNMLKLKNISVGNIVQVNIIMWNTEVEEKRGSLNAGFDRECDEIDSCYCSIRSITVRRDR